MNYRFASSLDENLLPRDTQFLDPEKHLQYIVTPREETCGYVRFWSMEEEITACEWHHTISAANADPEEDLNCYVALEWMGPFRARDASTETLYTKQNTKKDFPT